MSRSIASATAIVLMMLAPAPAQAVKPERIAYQMKMRDDPGARACILALSIKLPADETIDFELVVARMKRDGNVGGPAVFGFSIIAHDGQLARRRETAPRPTEVTSAVFISPQYTATARPRSIPFPDGSWVASTLDPEEGGELLETAVSGKFQIAYTRTRPIAARVFEVSSMPPLDVLMRFTGCVDGLQAIE